MADFWIGSKIGRGPVGTSYEGMLKEGRRPVVVKVISRRFHEYPDILKQILDDLQGWVGFDHANVVTTHAVTTYQDRHAVIYDKAPGETIEEYLRERGPLEPRLALLVLRDVSLALAVAHEGDVPAGDIRSSKIFFDGRKAMLADLGQFRASCMGGGFGRYGLGFGHPAYLAPEVLQEGLKEPTPQTDIYALGILFYELLTGTPPFEGEVRDILRAHVEQPIAPPP
jgi:serine/threonine-protein kinase